MGQSKRESDRVMESVIERERERKNENEREEVKV